MNDKPKTPRGKAKGHVKMEVKKPDGSTEVIERDIEVDDLGPPAAPPLTPKHAAKEQAKMVNGNRSTNTPTRKSKGAVKREEKAKVVHIPDTRAHVPEEKPVEAKPVKKEPTSFMAAVSGVTIGFAIWAVLVAVVVLVARLSYLN